MIEPNSEGRITLEWNRVFQAEKTVVQRYYTAGRKLGNGGKVETGIKGTECERKHPGKIYGLWSQKETRLVTDNDMGEIR